MLYIDGAYRGVENSWKNPQKIVKTACNSQNMVYSMSSYRVLNPPSKGVLK